MAKLKTCSFCNKETDRLWHANPKCCMNYQCKKEYAEMKSDSSHVSKSSIKATVRKPTGELQLFLKIYSERKGICEVTRNMIQFDVGCFAHILSKGAYPSFRLKPENIIMVDKRVHHLYDCSDRETLLKEFPNAQIIYDKKEQLKKEYYEQRNQ